MSINREKIRPVVFGDIPPQALDAEEAVISACLLEREAFDIANGILHTPEYFYSDSHSKIWKAMQACMYHGYPVDLITVTEALRKSGELDTFPGESSGAYYLTKLSMSVNSTAHVEHHCRIIVEKFMLRELIRISGQIMGDAYKDLTDPFDLLEYATGELQTISQSISGAGDLPIGLLFGKVLEDLDEQRRNKSALTGVDTGLYELNELTNGWQKTDLIIVGGRPSKGKTAFGLNMALAAVVSSIVRRVPVGVVSLEMEAKQLVKRIVATVTGIDFGKITTGNLTDAEFSTVVSFTHYFNQLPIRIYDKSRNWQRIKAQAKKWKDKHGIGLLVIDYLQLIRAQRKHGDNREQEIAGISADAKELAKNIDCPLIMLAQLNRSVESRQSPEPTPADLRESGSIEQDADLIIFPWHLNPNEARISIAKNRNGKTAIGDNAIKVIFSGNLQKWADPQEFERMQMGGNPRAGIVNNYANIRNPSEPTGTGWDTDAGF